MFLRMKSIGLGAAAACLVFGVLAGSTAAFGSSRSGGRTGAPPAAVPNFQAAGKTQEMQYVPLPSCVLVATRQGGGALADGESRSFFARGSGSKAGQGGDTGCGVPKNANVLVATLTASGATGAGHLKVKPTGGAGTGALAVSYVTGQEVSSSVNVDLAPPTTSKPFTIVNIGGPTHVIVTLVGYFIAPMSAYVNFDGTLLEGSRVVSSTRVNSGRYNVRFDRDISKCTYAVTPFGLGFSPAAFPLSEAPDTLFVGIWYQTNNSTADAYFRVTVFC